MFCLTREVRFAVNGDRAAAEEDRPTNSYGGYPSLRGFGHWLALTVTVARPLEAPANRREVFVFLALPNLLPN